MTRTTGPSTVGAIRRLAADERGSTAIEYALICGLISGTSSAASGPSGERPANLFQVVADAVKTTPPPPP
jgi:hypothetical protein